MDGGSTDGSVEIIKRYAGQLAHWESAPDGGQANAINKGLAQTTGEIICWLNSDDWYLPGALYAVALQYLERPFDFLYGGCLLRYEDRPLEYYVRMPQVSRRLSDDISVYGFIDQPSSFWSRRAWEQVGPLDESLTYAFDWDFFIRVSRAFSLRPTEGVYSAYRHHRAHKTGAGGGPRRAEVVEIVRRYAGGEWAAAYEDLNANLYPTVQDSLARWSWLIRRRGGWRLFDLKKRALLEPYIRRYGRHKVEVASMMLAISWDPRSE